MLVRNPPAESFTRLQNELPENILLQQTGEPVDAVLLFVRTLAETERNFPSAVKQVKPDGLLWLAYPKGRAKVKTDVNRDILWQALKPTGWRPVRIISLDDTWSVIRFRPDAGTAS